jgi:hypothetical protein
MTPTENTALAIYDYLRDYKTRNYTADIIPAVKRMHADTTLVGFALWNLCKQGLIKRIGRGKGMYRRVR